MATPTPTTRDGSAPSAGGSPSAGVNAGGSQGGARVDVEPYPDAAGGGGGAGPGAFADSNGGTRASDGPLDSGGAGEQAPGASTSLDANLEREDVRDASSAADGGAPGGGGAAGLGGGGGPRAGGGGAAGLGGGGGLRASGGVAGAVDSGIDGTCANVTPCGGDVVGNWAVVSSCLTVTGQADLSLLGSPCAWAPVTGSLQVTGVWTANADGSYVDGTTTWGSEQLVLPAACLMISSTSVACEKMGGLVAGAFGFKTSTCAWNASGECACTSTIEQAGGAGLVSVTAFPEGSYTITNNLVALDDGRRYTSCVSGNHMTWTPQSTYPTTTGTVVFQRMGGGAGGTAGSGGATESDGGRGGSTGSGGVPGGRGGAGGTTALASGPCDIYAADGGPCVAAHSTVRRLVGGYRGPLYQVRVGGAKSGTGGTMTDIGFLQDGFADSAAQDAACGANPCTISLIYDQSGNGNHLTRAPAGQAKVTSDNEADAKAVPIALGGRKVYGVHVVPGVGYRNNAAVGTATGDAPETIYMITAGNYYNGGCCFDYGNVETNNADNGEGALEAVYFGSCWIWNKGDGNGPWVMADLENGLWAGNVSPYSANKSLSYKYVTAMVKGDTGNHWAIKVGDAQTGALITPYDGPRPTPRYNPMKKEGGIVLGTAGDNSNGGQGNFFEGVMTARYASDAADDAVQANVVASYGN